MIVLVVIFLSCIIPIFIEGFQPSLVSKVHLSHGRLQKSFASIEDYTSTDQQVQERSKDWWIHYSIPDEEALAQSTRKDFVILSQSLPTGEQNHIPLIYLDSAATSQKPYPVIDSMTRYYQTINANVHRGAHTLSRLATAEYEKARDTVAHFLHATSREEIIFTSGATESINLVASTYGRQNIHAGDEILITEMEHHSNIVPWQMLALEKNATLKYIPFKKVDDIASSTIKSNIHNAILDWDMLPLLLTSKTKIVSLQHVSNVMACEHPIVDFIVPMVRKLAHPSVKIVLDACQSVPHMPMNVTSLGVDFVAASGHKMCGPTGIGILWGKLNILKDMPPYRGGGEMIDEVFMTHSTYTSPPGRFEAGTPNIANAIGLKYAIDYLTNIGMERIERYEKELGKYLFRRLEDLDLELGLVILGPPFVDRIKDEALESHDGSIELKPQTSSSWRTPSRAMATVAFVVKGVHPSDLSTFLDMEGIAIRAGHHCCQPLHRALGYSHSARASLYFYNTKRYVICK